jgi:hypothetical protein
MTTNIPNLKGLDYYPGAVKARGELISPTDQVNLTIQFKDQYGRPVNTDSYPTISLVQPSGLICLAPTSKGITHTGKGQYSYIFTTPINGPLGVWRDTWIGYINGFRVESMFEFIINTTQLPSINTDGFVHLGDDPGFNYSQTATKNVNKLIKSLRVRLNSSGKAKAADNYGNTVYVSCDIFSVDMLATFIATALWDFNQVPYFTFFNFDNDAFIEQFGEILVEGATIYALASVALIERGKEFQINDNGLSFTPPTMAEILQTQSAALATMYFDKLKMIKNSLRPNPLGLGIFGMQSGMNPLVRQLKHLRARQLF